LSPVKFGLSVDRFTVQFLKQAIARITMLRSAESYQHHYQDG